MELQLVKNDIQWEGDYPYLEEDMIYYCKELLEEKNLPLVTFKLGYDLSYSQGSGVWFKEFNISFDELIKYLLEVKTLTQIEYDILYSANEEGLYDFDLYTYKWNKIIVNTKINNINNFDHISKTFNLLKAYYKRNQTYKIGIQGYDWKSLANILSETQIELALKDLMDSICYDLKEYGYNYIEAEDEWNNKNDLVYEFFRLNNIEHNIEHHEGGEYIRTKQELLELNIPIETYTRINDNNLDDYYISNDIINSIEEKEKIVKYNSLII